MVKYKQVNVSRKTDSVQEINLYQLLQYFAKKWVVIVAFTVTGLVAGLVYSFYLQTPLYKSDATLILIDPEKTSSAAKDPTLINNYIELFKSRKVLEPVIEKLTLDKSYEQLVASVTTTSEKDTEVIKISVATEKADTSMMVADEAIASFKQEVGRLYDKDNIEIVDKANRPTEPYNVHTVMQVALTTAVGLVAALTLLFFVYDFTRAKPATAPKAKAKKAEQPKKEVVKAAPVEKPAATPPSPVVESLPANSDPLVSNVVNTLIGTQIQPKRKKTKKTKANKRKK